MSDFQQPADRIGEYVPKSANTAQAYLDNGTCYVDYTFEQWKAMIDKRHGKLKPKKEE